MSTYLLFKLLARNSYYADSVLYYRVIQILNSLFCFSLFLFYTGFILNFYYYFMLRET